VRAVLDTNVVVSALLWGGTPERLIETAGEGALELFTSEPLLAELAGILTRSKFAALLRRRTLSAADILARYRELAETVEVAPVSEAALRDPDDAVVLACAVCARADTIVSGDGDLLALGSYRGIRVLSPLEALRQIGAA
jgi:hypothetical protein